MKKFFWKYIISITFCSIILTAILGSEIYWENSGGTYISFSVVKKILYDILVGISSSMILVLWIDRLQYKMIEIEDSKRRQILYNKISQPIQDYYNFFLFLYISMRKKAVEENNLVVKSLYLVKDEFIKQIYDTEPFYKDSYKGDIDKFNIQMSMMEKAKNSDEKKKILENSISIPWYDCWSIEAKKIYDSLFQVERDYPNFFPNELLDKIDKLLDIAKMQSGITEFIEFKKFPFNLKNIKMPIEFFVEGNKIVETIEILDSVMEYIEKDSSKKLRERSLDFFNNRNVQPILGCLYK